jgi:hypothetical protein
MFFLIITIISIALVAALALATLYYGGKAFNKGSASADATKMLTQAQQLQGAAELYKADTGAYPLTMQDMLTNKYLTSVPVAALSPESAPALMGTANAAATPWVMVLAGYPVFAVTPVSEAVCKSINLKAYGQEGILKTARTSFVTQCYGVDVGHLIVVTSKTGAMLTTVAASPSPSIGLGAVINDAVPGVTSTDASAAGWLVAPGAVVVPPVASAVPPPSTGGTVVTAGGADPYVKVYGSAIGDVACPFPVGSEICTGSWDWATDPDNRNYVLITLEVGNNGTEASTFTLSPLQFTNSPSGGEQPYGGFLRESVVVENGNISGIVPDWGNYPVKFLPGSWAFLADYTQWTAEDRRPTSDLVSAIYDSQVPVQLTVAPGAKLTLRFSLSDTSGWWSNYTQPWYSPQYTAFNEMVSHGITSITLTPVSGGDTNAANNTSTLSKLY